MYNDEFDRINGEYRYNRTSNLPRDDYRPQYTPVPESPKKKGNVTVKVIALVLVCAIVGGLGGFGGAAIARNSHRGETAIQQSARAPVEVEIKKVDGQREMTPAEVYASTVNSTVSINTSATKRNVFGQVTESASSGSGFIITADGYIVEPVRDIPSTAVLNCSESGSTLRFMLPIAGALGVDTTFLLEGRLPRRPLYADQKSPLPRGLPHENVRYRIFRKLQK